MRKALHVITIIAGTMFLVCAYAANSVYVYEKIPDSEFRTYESKAVSGEPEFNETVVPPFGQYIVTMSVKNDSSQAINFSDARYAAIAHDGSVSYLTFEEAEFDDGVREQLVLDPGHTITVYCRTPVGNNNVQAICILLGNGYNVRFVPRQNL